MGENWQHKLSVKSDSGIAPRLANACLWSLDVISQWVLLNMPCLISELAHTLLMRLPPDEVYASESLLRGEQTRDQWVRQVLRIGRTNAFVCV